MIRETSKTRSFRNWPWPAAPLCQQPQQFAMLLQTGVDPLQSSHVLCSSVFDPSSFIEWFPDSRPGWSWMGVEGFAFHVWTASPLPHSQGSQPLPRSALHLMHPESERMLPSCSQLDQWNLTPSLLLHFAIARGCSYFCRCLQIISSSLAWHANHTLWHVTLRHKPGNLDLVWL